MCVLHIGGISPIPVSVEKMKIRKKLNTGIQVESENSLREESQTLTFVTMLCHAISALMDS